MRGGESGRVHQLDLPHAGEDGDPRRHGGQETELIGNQMDLDGRDGSQDAQVVHHEKPVGLLDPVPVRMAAGYPDKKRKKIFWYRPLQFISVVHTVI